METFVLKGKNCVTNEIISFKVKGDLKLCKVVNAIIDREGRRFGNIYKDGRILRFNKEVSVGDYFSEEDCLFEFDLIYYH